MSVKTKPLFNKTKALIDKSTPLFSLFSDLLYSHDYLATIFANQLEEFLNGFFLRDVLLYTFLGLVERDFAAACADIAVVGIGHLARTVDDAAHDADLQTHKVFSGSLDLCDGLLEVIKRTSATGTGDVFGLGELDTRGLKDGVGESGELRV